MGEVVELNLVGPFLVSYFICFSQVLGTFLPKTCENLLFLKLVRLLGMAFEFYPLDYFSRKVAHTISQLNELKVWLNPGTSSFKQY